MYFKHPDILYFLFLLIIPILVHLFQLRRFKKEYFSNVRFLKELSIQTRKSSKLKKWLLLCTRLLLLAAVIIAFAQPFFKSDKSDHGSNELYIILDNSHSMQARGRNGELLKRSIQELLESTPAAKNLSLLTNTEDFWNTDIRAITTNLQNLPYSAAPFNLEAQMAKIKSRKSALNKDIVIITDMLGVDPNQLKSIPTDANVYVALQKAERKSNISIDSLYMSAVHDNFYELAVSLSAVGDDDQPASVSVYNEGKLIAKTQTDLRDNREEIKFMLPKAAYNGYVALEDQGLMYDNTFYFSISRPERVQVISIGEQDKAAYLAKIFTESEFVYLNYPLASLPYNQLEKQDVIILNELKDIPEALQTTLKAFSHRGGNIVIVPAADADLNSLNALVRNFGSVSYAPDNEKDRLITRISFKHPLYKNVFEKSVTNFQYPKVKSGFKLSSAYPAALMFDDQSTFLTGISNGSGWVYLFSAAISRENSNLQNSPLIVPTFFNMASPASRSGVTAETIGSSAPLFVDAKLGQDEVIEVRPVDKNASSGFIPSQQALSGKVRVSFGDYPERAGNYTFYQGETALKNISFNYGRTESAGLGNAPAVSLDPYQVTDNLPAVFDSMNAERTDSQIWKWMLAIGLILLLTEIFIQKFVK